MLTVGDIITGLAVDLDYQGQGIIKPEGYVIFVPGLIDGEEAKVKIKSLRKSFGQGEVVEIIKKSKDRVEDSNSALGSCDFIHVSKDKQKKWQSRITKETLKKIANIDVEMNEILTDDKDKFYRNKNVFQVLDTPFLTLCLFSKDNSKLIPVSEFILADEKTNEVLKYLSEHKMVINPRVLKYMMFRTNLKGQILITLVATKELFVGRNELIAALKGISNLAGVTVNIMDDERSILGRESLTLLGENLIAEPLKNKNIFVNDRSFFQINLPVIELAYQIIAKNIDKDKVIIDAYSGVGSIGFYLADEAKKVIMIESNAESVEMAKKTKEFYHLDHIEIMDEPAEKIMHLLEGDVLVIDPPRNGLMPHFIDVVLNKNFEKIFYLSCDVKTLARDLAVLTTKFNIAKVHPIKMFYHTTSLETLVILTKK